MRQNALSGARLLLLGMALLLSGSCAGTVKGYPGGVLPADRTAIIRTGFYSDILKCDDIRLGPFQTSIAVLPGRHTVEMAFRKRFFGDRLLYSDVTGSVTFVAEAGHAYSINADLVYDTEWLGLGTYDYDWKGSVKDRATGQTIAVTTEALPVRIQRFTPGQLNDTQP